MTKSNPTNADLKYTLLLFWHTLVPDGPAPVTEYVFHPVRKWRLDVAWPAYRVAVELQGGVWSRGAHGRGSGIVRNFDKLNNAQIEGWCVLQFSTDMLRDPAAVVGLVQAAIASRERSQ